MSYHIERNGRGDYVTLEVWGGKPPRCVAILPADRGRAFLAERLAQAMVEAANQVERESGSAADDWQQCRAERMRKLIEQCEDEQSLRLIQASKMGEAMPGSCP